MNKPLPSVVINLALASCYQLVCINEL